MDTDAWWVTHRAAVDVPDSTMSPRHTSCIDSCDGEDPLGKLDVVERPIAQLVNPDTYSKEKYFRP